MTSHTLSFAHFCGQPFGRVYAVPQPCRLPISVVGLSYRKIYFCKIFISLKKQTLVVQYNSPNLHVLSQGRHIFVVDYLTYMIKIYYNVENVQVSKRVTTVIL